MPREVTEITVTAVPGMQVVALEVGEGDPVVLQPAAAAHTGLLLMRASFQAAAAVPGINLETVAHGLDAIESFMHSLGAA